jgi:translation initiation factor 1
MKPAKPKPNPTQRGERTVYAEFGPATEPAAPMARPEPPPNQQNLRVQMSRKGRKGKTVTIITGWQLGEESLQTHCKKLKSLCGAGGTVKDDTIEIQGEHQQKVLAWLIEAGFKAKLG